MSGVNWAIRSDLDGGAATVHSDGVLHEVWWDTQDAGNPGYAYRATGEMINESGPLDAPTLADAITEYEELVSAIDEATTGQKE
jgi:hypothetical protein